MFSHLPFSVVGILRCPYTWMAETQEPDLAVEFNLRMGQVHPGVTGLCNSSLLALPNLNWARAAKGIAQ